MGRLCVRAPARYGRFESKVWRMRYSFPDRFDSQQVQCCEGYSGCCRSAVEPGQMELFSRTAVL